ncbi:MAG: hypothetical protein KIT69_08060 [Propionibacteriaceae bacterium]|nr:hypothetical protein [Propionibacteriaceae bacterium]
MADLLLGRWCPRCGSSRASHQEY